MKENQMEFIRKFKIFQLRSVTKSTFLVSLTNTPKIKVEYLLLLSITKDCLIGQFENTDYLFINTECFLCGSYHEVKDIFVLMIDVNGQ